MVSENPQNREVLQAAFRSEKQKECWEAWVRSSGNCRVAAKELGLRVDTVRDHINDVAIRKGMGGIKEMKVSLGFASRVEQDEVSAEALRSLLEIQGYRCALTGERLSPDTAELDHKVPLAMGGTNDLGNLQWLCRDANRAKGTMDNEAFIKLCAAVAKWSSRSPYDLGSSSRS